MRCKEMEHSCPSLLPASCLLTRPSQCLLLAPKCPQDDLAAILGAGSCQDPGHIFGKPSHTIDLLGERRFELRRDVRPCFVQREHRAGNAALAHDVRYKYHI